MIRQVAQVYFRKKQFSLLKSVKQQISYFSQLPKKTLTLYKNLHGNMLLIFILMNFLRKHHLLNDKQKDPTPIKFTTSPTFFLTRAIQHKIKKIGLTILSLSQLKLYILQDCKHAKKHLSSYILFTLKNTRNSAFHIFIKYYTL